tara:strand:+ start:237 stop:509 length:273 start_codon:yes stop_codon:yes gene_type:complete
MIFQLQDGRMIELSIEQYLSLNDVELHELVGLSTTYTKEYNNPFHNLFSKSIGKEEIIKELKEDEEFEPDLFEIDDEEKLEDDYFHPDDY